MVNSEGYIVEEITNESKNIERIKEGIWNIEILESTGTSRTIYRFKSIDDNVLKIIQKNT